MQGELSALPSWVNASAGKRRKPGKELHYVHSYVVWLLNTMYTRGGGVWSSNLKVSRVCIKVLEVRNMGGFHRHITYHMYTLYVPNITDTRAECLITAAHVNSQPASLQLEERVITQTE